MIYLVNPTKKGRKAVMAKRPVPKGFSSWKAYMAHIRGFKRKGRKVNIAAKTGRKYTYRKNEPNPPASKRGSRRAYRPNPFRNIPGRLIDGVTDAAELLGGKVIARSVPKVVGIEDRDSTTGLIVQALAGAAAGIGASYLSPNVGKMVLAGGLSAPLEKLLKDAKLPVVSSALGDDDLEMVDVAAYPELMGYPHGRAALMPPSTIDTMGDEEEAVFYQ